jgi:hypothetical protein
MLDYTNSKGLIPVSAEIPMAGGIRTDLICKRASDGGIVIIEIKTGEKGKSPHTMSTKTLTKHMTQLCKYGVTWNHTDFAARFGPCVGLILHYPDQISKPWHTISPDLWEVYAPPKPPKEGVVATEDPDEMDFDEDGNIITEVPRRKRRRPNGTGRPRKSRARRNPNYEEAGTPESLYMTDAMARTLGVGQYEGIDLAVGRARC